MKWDFTEIFNRFTKTPTISGLIENYIGSRPFSFVMKWDNKMYSIGETVLIIRQLNENPIFNRCRNVH